MIRQPRTIIARINLVCACLLVLIGAVHMAMTPIFKPAMNEESLWFAGGGLAFAFLGLLNISRHLRDGAQGRGVCMAANIAGTGYLLVVALALPEPQVFLSLAIAITVAITSLVPASLAGIVRG